MRGQTHMEYIPFPAKQGNTIGSPSVVENQLRRIGALESVIIYRNSRQYIALTRYTLSYVYQIVVRLDSVVIPQICAIVSSMPSLHPLENVNLFEFIVTFIILEWYILNL